MTKSKSLARRHKTTVERTLKDVADGQLVFEPGDEMMQWIEGQFEDPASALSKLFSAGRRDRTKSENWKWLLWVLAEVHYSEGRGQKKTVWPEEEELRLIKEAAQNREQHLHENGKTLSLSGISAVLVRREPYRTLKTGREKGSKRTTSGLTTQLKNIIKKFKSILMMPTIAADKFGDSAEITRILAVLSPH